MPCSKYKDKQRKLCFATKEWTDFSKIKKLKKDNGFKWLKRHRK